MKASLQFLRKNPEIIFFICLLILWTAIMCNENAKEGGDFRWHDIKVEANGMIFDLFVFGVLVSIYNALRASKEKTERLKEEIDDYRGWNEKEAMYRIVGAVKRLNKLGVSRIILTDCFLSGAHLSGERLTTAEISRADLSEAHLSGADLRKAHLLWANLSGADLTKANLSEAHLFEANLSGADLSGANLTKAYLVKANFSGANLTGADLTEAKLGWTNFSGAKVSQDWFEKLEEWKIEGREEIIEKYLIDKNGILRLK